ncbi:MAG: IS21-like element helper ATPase IstB [Burkholderiales bacterium]|nr:IS21-like element helper ATPase IstB [Burkholderiales bacterium]
MLVQPTLDTLNQLKLHGMAIALSEQMTQTSAQSLPFEDRLGLLVERELTYRENRRLTRLLQLAQLKERAALEDLDFRARRGLDRAQLASLTSCDWIRQHQNLLIHGATGCGKTFLGCALAHQACRQGLSALYLRAPRLFDELSLCHADGSFRKRLAAIAKVELVVIDDFAIAPIGPRERTDLLELLDDRVGARSTLITSQLPIENWHEYIGDPTLADAILDRLVHSAHKIHLEGESMRKRAASNKTGKSAKPTLAP